MIERIYENGRWSLFRITNQMKAINPYKTDLHITFILYKDHEYYESFENIGQALN